MPSEVLGCHSHNPWPLAIPPGANGNCSPKQLKGTRWLSWPKKRTTWRENVLSYVLTLCGSFYSVTTRCLKKQRGSFLKRYRPSCDILLLSAMAWGGSVIRILLQIKRSIRGAKNKEARQRARTLLCKEDAGCARIAVLMDLLGRCRLAIHLQAWIGGGQLAGI